MSQYPSPYYPPNVQPPYYPYSGALDVLAPARRASVMMFILGPMLKLCGACVMSMPLMFSMMPQDKLQPLLNQIQSQCGYPAKVVIPVLGAFIFLPGVAMLILAFFVRRGGRVSAILGCALVGLILLKSVVELLFSFLHPDPNVMGAICLDIFSVGIFGLLFFWLIQAARASSSVQQAQQQYLAQYWQYQQNMQAHSGYGYAAPPQEGQSYQPAPPPPPVPAPLPGDDSSAPPPVGG